MTGDERALLRTVRALARRPARERAWLVRRLTMPEKRTLDEFWPAWRHEGQAPPPDFAGPGGGFAGASARLAGRGGGDGLPTWLMMTGRGIDH